MRALVVVTGPPASGKSALAAPLAEQLGFPLVTKDTVKEALFDALGTGDAAWSAKLSDAAYEILFALAPALPQAVLEANFRAEHAPRFTALSGTPHLLQVNCVCPPEERRRRWSARRRHPGHLDAEHPIPPAGEEGPLDLGPHVLEVDTAGAVDVSAVAVWVRHHLQDDPGA